MNFKSLELNSIKNIIAIIIFLFLSYAYFPQVLEGKRLQQHDNMMYRGMAKENTDYRNATGKETLWSNSMFSGMPTYLGGSVYKGNIMVHIDRFLRVGPRPASYTFITMLGFYLLLMAFGVNPWLAIVGGIAFGFSSYNMIIMGAGHNSKAVALAYLPAVIGTIVYTIRKNLWLGAALFGIAFSLELLAGHPQITYYGFLIILIYGIVELIQSIKEKSYVNYLKKIGVLAIIALIAVSTNFTSLYFTYDYGKDSIRGKSDLSTQTENRTSGLDKDYATQWSYGIAESFNLMIPNFMGGSSSGGFDKNSETYKVLKKNGIPNALNITKSMPSYWGAQPITSGPAYIGAVIVFFFVLGIFLIKGRFRWWLVSATVLGIMLAWGKNFMFLTDLFLDYFPGYNKFRAVSMTMVIPQITVPLLALLGINRIVKEDISKAEFMKAFKWTIGIVGGLALFFLLFGSSLFSFTSPSDDYFSQGFKPLKDALIIDRIALFKADTFRTLLIVLASAASVYFFYTKKLKQQYFIIIVALLVIVDLWPVDKRYLNKSNFASKKQVENPVQPSKADLQILNDKDIHYRVMNVSVNTFNDATTSFFHKSIGGYHGAKMRRYQEIIEHHISQNNMSVLNMLNTKYFIVPSNSGQPTAQLNPDALGNAWFVNSFKLVENADQEIDALSSFNPKTECIVDKRFEEFVSNFAGNQMGVGSITLTEYQPNYLKYQSANTLDGLAVFSEIHYQKGWKAYIDGEEHPHFRVNYVLRALDIPAGEHTIEFRFDPPMYSIGTKISLGSSVLLILLAAGAVFYQFKISAKDEE